MDACTILKKMKMTDFAPDVESAAAKSIGYIVLVGLITQK